MFVNLFIFCSSPFCYAEGVRRVASNIGPRDYYRVMINTSDIYLFLKYVPADEVSIWRDVLRRSHRLIGGDSQYQDIGFEMFEYMTFRCSDLSAEIIRNQERDIEHMLNISGDKPLNKQKNAIVAGYLTDLANSRTEP